MYSGNQNQASGHKYSARNYRLRKSVANGTSLVNGYVRLTSIPKKTLPKEWERYRSRMYYITLAIMACATTYGIIGIIYLLAQVCIAWR